MGTANLKDWALHLASRGWRVFPLVPGSKRPAIAQWEQRATTDDGRIARCWAAGAGWNVGVATGPSGLVVVDLDPPKTPDAPDGAEGLAALAAERAVALDATWTVGTPRGGRHLYYRCPPGVRLRNSAGHLAPGVDTRAGGGYVVAPGSVLPGGGYELLDDTDPAELPAWLVQALSERPTVGLSATAEIAPASPTSYGAAALAGEADRVRQAPPGQHNSALNRAAWRCGQLIAAGLLAEPTARAALTEAAQSHIAADCDCTPTSVARVITAGITAGARSPRRAGRRAA